MLRKYFVLGTFFGIQLRIDYSWFVIFALIAWLITSDYIPAYKPGLSPVVLGIAGFVVSLLFFASVVVHEYAHSIVGNRYGLRIRRITLFMLGGASELHHEPKTARAELRMAAAGPLTSLLLGGMFTGLWLLARGWHLTALEIICQPLIILNFGVALFNLLPAFPLDGGRILRASLWFFRKNYLAATRGATTTGILLAYVMVAIGVTEVLYGYLLSGIWWGFIGYFLLISARFSYYQASREAVLRGVRVAQLLDQQFIPIPAGTSVEQYMTDFVLHYKQYDFLVTGIARRPVGIISFDRIRPGSTNNGAEEIDAYMEPLRSPMRVKPDDTAVRAFHKMEQYRLPLLPVMSGDQCIGIVQRTDLEQYVQLHPAPAH